MNFIDIHCHVLPYMDDGPQDMDESLEMLKMAADDGITCIFATPHIIEGTFDNKSRDIITATDNIRNHMPDGVKIFPGSDVRITPDLLKKVRDRKVLTLDRSCYLLIELPPSYSLPPGVSKIIFDLRGDGITPIITHPERYIYLMNDLHSLSKLRDAGAMFQITAMSITGDFGRDMRRVSLSMIEKGFVDFVASDAHNSKRRPPILSKAYEEVKRQFSSEIADTLFLHNPEKIMNYPAAETAGYPKSPLP